MDNYLLWRIWTEKNRCMVTSGRINGNGKAQILTRWLVLGDFHVCSEHLRFDFCKTWTPFLVPPMYLFLTEKMGNYANPPHCPIPRIIVIYFGLEDVLILVLLTVLTILKNKVMWCHHSELMSMSFSVYMAELYLVQWLCKDIPYWTCQVSILCNYLLWR